MENDISVLRRLVRRGKSESQMLRQFRTALVGVDQRDVGSRQSRRQVRDQQPDHAAADHDDAIARSGAAIP